ncbi:MAG: DUF4465 domain-containing protein [Rikenellaceae bacterium]|nr:DUF4465 domain-containing protein [Rikenellaceae bacterium]
MKKLCILFMLSVALLTGCKKDELVPPAEFQLELPAELTFEAGETRSFDYTASGDYTVAITFPEGWAAKAENNQLQITAPEANLSAQFTGDLNVTALQGTAILYDRTASLSTLATLTFEEVPAEYLAGPTAYGENLYSTYTEGTPYTGYSDTRTGLGWEINEAFGSRDFWNGGVAVSRWNDRSTTGTGNQCSVYAEGGAGGSLTFAVATGMLNDYGGDYARIAFGGQTEELIESFQVSNATYPALSMIEGDAFAKQFTYEDADWLKLVITGYNAAGTATGTVDYYLADFRSATAPGVVEGWKQVNLSSLGKVNRLEFSFESSDTGLYGVNTPTYFCFDDLVIKK